MPCSPLLVFMPSSVSGQAVYARLRTPSARPSPTRQNQAWASYSAFCLCSRIYSRYSSVVPGGAAVVRMEEVNRYSMLRAAVQPIACAAKILAVFLNVIPLVKVVIITLKFLSILDSQIVCTVILCFTCIPFIDLNMDC